MLVEPDGGLDTVYKLGSLKLNKFCTKVTVNSNTGYNRVIVKGKKVKEIDVVYVEIYLVKGSNFILANYSFIIDSEVCCTFLGQVVETRASNFKEEAAATFNANIFVVIVEHSVKSVNKSIFL